MEIRVMSRRRLRTYIEGSHYEKLAVIGFYEPNEKPRRLPENVNAYFVNAADIGRDTLKEMGMSYGKYLPEADDIAGFILDAYRENRNIICFCEYGQSISAGCAAAIAEYFENDGIRFFSDYRFSPNQLVFHKIFNALGRVGGRKHSDENTAYIFSRKYADIFSEKLDIGGENYSELLDFLSESEEIISDRYWADSAFIANIACDRGSVLCRSGQYEAAVSQYETAAEFYFENGMRIDGNIAAQQLAMALARSGNTDKAIKTAQSIRTDNKAFIGYLLADIYCCADDFSHALCELQRICDAAKAPQKKAAALCRSGHLYYRMGDKKAAVKYLSEAYKLLSDSNDENEFLTEKASIFDR